MTDEIDKLEEELEFHFKKADQLATIIVEKMARKILKDNSHFHEFIMGMGSISFTFNSIDPTQDNTVELDEFEETSELNLFIEKWDDLLRITGTAMRFTANGPKITER